MSQNKDTYDSQSQDPPSQIHIDDHFSEPNTLGSSSLFAEPSSYFSQTVAYGTNINVPAAAGEIRQFIQKFKLNETDNLPHYLEKIREMHEIEQYNLNIDMNHVKKFQDSLYIQIISFPLEMIQIFDSVVKEMFQSIYPTDSDQSINKVQVRPYNLLENKTIRSLHPSDIDRLVSVRGMVTRTSQVIPDLSEAALKCRNCQRIEKIPVANGKVNEPSKCPGCGGYLTYEIEHNLCSFSDRQHIRIQESPETIPQGETPQTIGAIVFEELVDYARPGDRVEITGVWRAMPARINPRVRTLHSV